MHSWETDKINPDPIVRMMEELEVKLKREFKARGPESWPFKALEKELGECYYLVSIAYGRTRGEAA